MTTLTINENASLHDVAIAADAVAKDRNHAVDLVVQWMEDNPEQYAAMAEQRDRLLATYLITACRRNVNQTLSVTHERGVETKPRVSAETSIEMTQRMARFDWLQFKAAGKNLGDCRKDDLQQHAESERKKGAGHLTTAIFMEKIAASVGNRKVRTKFTHEKLQALHDAAREEAKQQMLPDAVLAIAGV